MGAHYRRVMSTFCIALAFTTIVLGAKDATSKDCSSPSVGVDTAKAESVGISTYWGIAIGETFLAPTREINSITVWRVREEDSLSFGLHLYLCNVDSIGAPLTQSLLLDGRTINVPLGDGIHPLPFRFDFDPPFALPAPGRFAFFIRVDPCYAWSDFLVDADDGYKDGSVWKTGRSLSDCLLRPISNQYPQLDLVFNIEFCDLATPVRKSSWGRLKAIYR